MNLAFLRLQLQLPFVSWPAEGAKNTKMSEPGRSAVTLLDRQLRGLRGNVKNKSWAPSAPRPHPPLLRGELSVVGLLMTEIRDKGWGEEPRVLLEKAQRDVRCEAEHQSDFFLKG